MDAAYQVTINFARGREPPPVPQTSHRKKRILSPRAGGPLPHCLSSYRFQVYRAAPDQGVPHLIPDVSTQQCGRIHSYLPAALGLAMTVSYLDGFYEQEHDGIRFFRWMGPEGELAVPTHTRLLELCCCIPDGSSELTIDADGLVKSYPLFAGWGRIAVPLPDGGSGLLKLRCGNEVNAPGDSRKLAIALADVACHSNIPAPILPASMDDCLAGYTRQYKSPEHENAYNAYHRKRYQLTLELLHKMRLSPEVCFEQGGGGFFTHLLERLYPEATIYTPAVDLRGRHPFGPDFLDMILCMEVFEHLSDPVGHQEIHMDGIFSMLCETVRTLKEHGVFIVTTPNPASISSLKRLIAHKHPYECQVHYREFTPEEFKDVLSLFFRDVELFTCDVYCHTEPDDPIFLFCDNKDRGDTTFCLCRNKIALPADLNELHLAMFTKIFPQVESLGYLQEVFRRKQYFQSPSDD